MKSESGGEKSLEHIQSKDRLISEEDANESNPHEKEEVNHDDIKRDGLGTVHVAAYSVGHFNNDLCASMWFVYLSWYINKVVGLNSNLTGLCLLSGQIADGITTPIVGVSSDKFNTRFGKRMPWYYFGTIMVVPCFMGIFAYPNFVNKLNDNGDFVNPNFRIAWYITLPALFNVGWASVQISNMSIVNQLSNSNRRRDRLVNNRNGFTYAANIVVLTLALIEFLYVDNKIKQFRWMCFISLGLGAFTSLFYMCTIAEVKLTKAAEHFNFEYKKITMGEEAAVNQLKNEELMRSSRIGKDWKSWLKEGTFYIHGFVYMFVRIAVNVTMTMQPFYLHDVTGYKGTDDNPTPVPLALVPLCSYVTQMIFSIGLQSKMTRCLRNRFYPMAVAIILITATSIPIGLLNEDPKVRGWVYPLNAIQGVGLAIMLNTATSLISDVIGNDAENSAFVYGCYSFFDKVANGLLLYWTVASYSEDAYALRYIMSVIPIGTSICAFILTYIGNKYFGHKLAKITGLAPK